MTLHRCFLGGGWIVGLVLSWFLPLVFSARAAGPPSDWKVVDTFQLTVDVYPRQAGSDKLSESTEKPKPSASYTMHAVLLPVLPFEECGCWKLQFASFSKLPEFKDMFRLWIDKGNGHTRKASRFIGLQETPLPAASIATIVLDAPPGYPLEVIPDMATATIPTTRPGTTLEITASTVDGASQRKAILRVNGKAEIEIRQRWLPGAKWWSEYERFFHGCRELHARLLTPKSEPVGPPPAVSPRSPAVPPAAPPAADDFRADPRLQVRITANFQHLPLQDVLDLLSRETNVSLTMERGLAATAPQVGSSGLFRVPAWKVMEGICRDFVTEGRWNKTRAGYELSARRAALPTVSPEAVPRRSWSGILCLLFGPPIILGIMYFIRNKCRQSSRSVSEAKTDSVPGGLEGRQ